jgi:hypothetical protein
MADKYEVKLPDNDEDDTFFMAALFLMDISWYENPYGLCAV